MLESEADFDDEERTMPGVQVPPPPRSGLQQARDAINVIPTWARVTLALIAGVAAAIVQILAAMK